MSQKSKRLLPAHRLGELRNLLRKHEKDVVDLDFLADRFEVSVQTIRRDLDILAGEGLVQRTFGGAVIQSSLLQLEPEVAIREVTAYQQKRAIAHAVKELMLEGESVFVDASTTVHEFLTVMPHGFRLDATTPSLQNAREAANQLSGNLTVLGGAYRSSADCVGGTTTVEQASRMRFNTAVLSARALSLKRGLTEAIADEAALKRVVIDNSERIIALIDSSKIESVAAYHFMDLDRIDVLVVDSLIAADHLAQLQDKIAQVVIAPVTM